MVTFPAAEEPAGQASIGSGGAGTHVLAVPMDPRVPKIRIRTRQLAQVKQHVPFACSSFVRFCVLLRKLMCSGEIYVQGICAEDVGMLRRDKPVRPWDSGRTVHTLDE